MFADLEMREVAGLALRDADPDDFERKRCRESNIEGNVATVSQSIVSQFVAVSTEW